MYESRARADMMAQWATARRSRDQRTIDERLRELVVAFVVDKPVAVTGRVAAWALMPSDLVRLMIAVLAVFLMLRSAAFAVLNHPVYPKVSLGCAVGVLPVGVPPVGVPPVGVHLPRQGPTSLDSSIRL
ncbi:hypothetical protein V496_09069 [Pseudogymnoascus sp. VKM F-4515 (FW-2607)]|nr:hypothetical protein V496_09069 [Pseudogymnoascus sp. VKM F-4515 (FW-2607)]